MADSKLKEVCKYFFKLGWVAFGGPAAHVAMMQDDLVEKKSWLSNQEFLDYMGATNLIPGPNSTEMTMHCGYHRGGAMGLFVAGISFIFPAVYSTMNDSILPWAFEFYYSFTETGEFTTESSEQLLEQHYYALGDNTLIYGDGMYKRYDGMYYGLTDAGYMRHAMYYGIPGIILFILTYFNAVVYSYKNSSISSTVESSIYGRTTSNKSASIASSSSTCFLNSLKTKPRSRERSASCCI